MTYTSSMKGNQSHEECLEAYIEICERMYRRMLREGFPWETEAEINRRTSGSHPARSPQKYVEKPSEPEK